MIQKYVVPSLKGFDIIAQGNALWPRLNIKIKPCHMVIPSGKGRNIIISINQSVNQKSCLNL